MQTSLDLWLVPLVLGFALLLGVCFSAANECMLQQATYIETMVQATYFEPMVQATNIETMVQATNTETMVQATNIETLVLATNIETMVQTTYIEPRVAQHKEHVTYLYDYYIYMTLCDISIEHIYISIEHIYIYWTHIYIYHILVGFKVIHVGIMFCCLRSRPRPSLAFGPGIPLAPRGLASKRGGVNTTQKSKCSIKCAFARGSAAFWPAPYISFSGFNLGYVWVEFPSVMRFGLTIMVSHTQALFLDWKP